MPVGQTLQIRPALTNVTRPTLTPTTASTVDPDKIAPERLLNLDGEGDDDVRSHSTSFVSSKANDDALDGLGVTRLQALSKDGTPFECPYCFAMMQTKRQRTWRRHVFRDLRAYVCTFEQCTAGLFEDREAWFQHEMDVHRRQWVCQSCPSRPFKEVEQFERHLQKAHLGTVLSQNVLSRIVEASSHPIIEIAASACPFCDSWDSALRVEAKSQGLLVPDTDSLNVPTTRFQQHLAEHQEQLALFAITPEIEARSDSHSGSHGEPRGSEDASDEAMKQWQAGIRDRGESDDEGPREGGTSAVMPPTKVGHVRHLKMEDGMPLWRRDIQYDFLKCIFSNDKRCFSKYSEGPTGRAEYTFAEIYADAILRSTTHDTFLRSNSVNMTPQVLIEISMISLLINIGRMRTTVTFSLSDQAHAKTYHPVPAFQGNLYLLPDGATLKTLLRAACEDAPQPSNLGDITAAEIPRTNPINLIFVMSQYAPRISDLHFEPLTDWFELFTRKSYSSESRARAFLWLMWWYLQSDFMTLEASRQLNPFRWPEEGVRTKSSDFTWYFKIPDLVPLSAEAAASENVDTQEELEFGERMRRERRARAPIVRQVVDPDISDADSEEGEAEEQDKSSDEQSALEHQPTASASNAAEPQRNVPYSGLVHVLREVIEFLSCADALTDMIDQIIDPVHGTSRLKKELAFFSLRAQRLQNILQDANVAIRVKSRPELDPHLIALGTEISTCTREAYDVTVKVNRSTLLQSDGTRTIAESVVPMEEGFRRLEALVSNATALYERIVSSIETLQTASRVVEIDPKRSPSVSLPEKSSGDPKPSESQPKGILKKPTKRFPEDSTIRMDVIAPSEFESKRGVPSDARWTKIDRRLVSPEALEEAEERFEERPECVIVLRVLLRDQIQKLADRTKEMREEQLGAGDAEEKDIDELWEHVRSFLDDRDAAPTEASVFASASTAPTRRFQVSIEAGDDEAALEEIGTSQATPRGALDQEPIIDEAPEPTKEVSPRNGTADQLLRKSSEGNAEEPHDTGIMQEREDQAPNRSSTDTRTMLGSLEDFPSLTGGYRPPTGTPSGSSRTSSILKRRLSDPATRDTKQNQVTSEDNVKQKAPVKIECHLCHKTFRRAYNLRSHLRTHTGERPYMCKICGKSFSRQQDRQRHELSHSGERAFVCGGTLLSGVSWGCSRRFSRLTKLGQHFKSDAGYKCIKPLIDARCADQDDDGPAHGGPLSLPSRPDVELPPALLQLYPAFATIDWSSVPLDDVPDTDAYTGRNSTLRSPKGGYHAGDTNDSGQSSIFDSPRQTTTSGNSLGISPFSLDDGGVYTDKPQPSPAKIVSPTGSDLPADGRLAQVKSSKALSQWTRPSLARRSPSYDVSQDTKSPVRIPVGEGAGLRQLSLDISHGRVDNAPHEAARAGSGSKQQTAPEICLNRLGQRIDLTLANCNPELVQRVLSLHLCHLFFLSHCPYGKQCIYRYDYDLNDEEKLALMRAARRARCWDGTKCLNRDCVASHHCVHGERCGHEDCEWEHITDTVVVKVI